MATSSGLTRATRSIPGKTTRSRATSLAMVSPTAFGTLLNRSLIFAFHIRRYFGRPRRREAACHQPLSSTLNQSQSDQQDNRADEGVDDRGDHTAADYYADLRQQPASEQTAENANDDVAYQPVTTAFDHHPGKPTSDGTDDQPNDECLYVHLSPRFLARKGLVPSQLLYSRFVDRPRRREAATVH